MDLSQNPLVPTRSPGDSTNAAASTAFVQSAIAAATPTGFPLTEVNDTNVTLTLGGTPATALLQAVSLTLGWTGTLAAARLNANVVQSITNDTNITGSLSAQNLTFVWAGTLANARLAAMAAWTIKGNVTSGSAAPTDFTIDGLTLKATPVGADEIIIWDVAGTAIKKATVSSISGSGTSGTLVSIVTYSSTQTITIPAGATKAFIRMWGATGGSGGISSAVGAGGATTGNTGAGGYLEKYLTGLTPAATLAYTQA